MQQSALDLGTIYDAIGCAVQVAGGTKRVASKLWPALGQSSAEARLRCSLNPEHAQKLDPEELSMVIGLAMDAGNFSVMEFLARKHGFEIKPLSPVEAKKRARRVRRLALLDELKRLEDEES